MSASKQIPGLAACCAVAGAVALAGCGSSSSSGLWKAQLAAKANAQCNAYSAAATKVPQPKDFVSNPVAAAAYLDQLKPLAAAEERAMLALKPDKNTKALWDQFVAAGEHMTALFNDADAKAHARNRAGLNDLIQFASYKSSTLDPIAKQLGADACAK
jgi:hypothetical protein